MLQFQYQHLGSIGIGIAASNVLRGEGGGWRDSRDQAESLEKICNFSAGYTEVVDCINSGTYSPTDSISAVKIGRMEDLPLDTGIYDRGKSDHLNGQH